LDVCALQHRRQHASLEILEPVLDMQPGQGFPILLLDHFPAEFSSNTPAWQSLVILMCLIRDRTKLCCKNEMAKYALNGGPPSHI